MYFFKGYGQKYDFSHDRITLPDITNYTGKDSIAILHMALHIL